jgi:hypothetical protein
MVSCTDRTRLELVLKQALCLAELIIIVPAPLWVSCTYPAARPYAEFNFESVGLASFCHVSAGLVKNLSRVIVEDGQVFDDGAVTFLPLLGESQHRWSDPDLGLPELPRPYSEQRGHYTPSSVYMEAVYGLCSERLAAERLGAMHLNAASFTEPVFGDLTISKQPQAGDWERHLWEISVPDLSTLALSDVARLRGELTDAVTRFSRAVMRALSSKDAHRHIAEATPEDLQEAASDLTHQIESALPQLEMKNKLATTTVVFGLGGQQGGILQTVDFLVGGGTLSDLVRLITMSKERSLAPHEDSFWSRQLLA